MGKLINRIPGSLFWCKVYQAWLWERMLNRSASLAMSTSVLKALPGKLDIKRHSSSILYFSYLQSISGKACSKRHSYQFANVQNHGMALLESWRWWSISTSSLSGLEVTLYHRNWLINWLMILLVARRRMIILISSEADRIINVTYECYLGDF